jgi:hypothetical protein
MNSGRLLVPGTVVCLGLLLVIRCSPKEGTVTGDVFIVTRRGEM